MDPVKRTREKRAIYSRQPYYRVFFVPVILIYRGIEIMGVNYFTDEQVEEFRKNPYVKNVSNKAITYEEKFKEYFYEQYTKGVSPTQIFRNAGFDTDLLGHKRIDGFYRRNRACTIRDEGFIDKRKGSSGRPKAKDLTPDEEIARLKHKNKVLQQENDFLKRVRFINKKQIFQASKTKRQKKNTNS